MRSSKCALTVVALSSLLGGSALAENPPRAADPAFVEQAVSSNQAEITMGKLALRNGSSRVRKIAWHLLTDHQRANEQLKQIVLREGSGMPPDSLNADQQSTVDRLTDLSGKEFDKAYLDAMKRDHEQVISLFQDEVSSGADAQLRSFAQATLPTLHKHSEMVSASRHKL